MPTFEYTMRTGDRMAFRDAAKHFSCWILVRAINPDSIGYLADPRYTPKPIDCKPKTADADVGGKNVAGLVIVPAVHGTTAFRGPKFSKAQACWESFLQVQRVVAQPAPGTTDRDRGVQEAQALNAANGDYQVDLDPKSPHFGVLQFHGKWIHGDFDLKDIIPQGQERRNLASIETLRGQPHMRGPLFYKIQCFVNARLGKEMIQHGGEAQYADHSDDIIDVFGPQGQHVQLGSASEIAAWYQRYQREVIDLAKAQPQPPHPGKSPEELRAGFRLIQGGRVR